MRKSSEYFVIASERKPYRVADCIIAAEEFRKYFGLEHCDIVGPYRAHSLAHAIELALDSNPQWRPDCKLKEIYRALTNYKRELT